MVLVFNKDGTRLMPCHPAKARILLKKKKAKIVKFFPFTIKLNYQIDNPKLQDVTIGLDPGKIIGISITTNKRVLLEGQLEQRTDIPKLLEARKSARRTRRNRLRYRKPRFNNRKKIYNKQADGWIPPSMQASLLTYINIVKFFNKYICINKVRYEYNTFDIQKIKNPNIQGKQYQQGDSYQEENIKSYVRKRDKYTCQRCKKSLDILKKDNIKLQVHHIKPKSQGGTDVPKNLVTLCEHCHKQVHEYLKKNKEVKFNIKEYKEDTKLNILKDRIYKELIRLEYEVDSRACSDLGADFGTDAKGVSTKLKIEKIYGYETKIKRIQLGLEKDHHIDARIIADNCYKRSKHDVQVYYMKKIRNHNRKIYKDKILKGNIKKRNIQNYEKNGYRRYDIVRYLNRYWYVNGRMESGQLALKMRRECWVRIPNKRRGDKIELRREIRPKYSKVKLVQKCSKYI